MSTITCSRISKLHGILAGHFLVIRVCSLFNHFLVHAVSSNLCETIVSHF